MFDLLLGRDDVDNGDTNFFSTTRPHIQCLGIKGFKRYNGTARMTGVLNNFVLLLNSIEKPQMDNSFTLSLV